jgi:hypothetical protein
MAERIPNQRRMAGHVEERSFPGERTSYLWKEIRGSWPFGKGFEHGVKVEASPFDRASSREILRLLCFYFPAGMARTLGKDSQVHDFEHEPSRLMIEEARLSASMKAERVDLPVTNKDPRSGRRNKGEALRRGNGSAEDGSGRRVCAAGAREGRCFHSLPVESRLRF